MADVMNTNEWMSIAAGTINMYYPALSQDSPQKIAIARNIVSHKHETTNQLHDKIQNTAWTLVHNKIDNIKNWVQAHCNNNNNNIANNNNNNNNNDNDTQTQIPSFTLKHLETICQGRYCFLGSKRYVATKFDNVSLFVNDTYPNVIKVSNIGSAYKTGSKHEATVEFANDGLDGASWCCDCKVGKRVTNPCAHNAAVFRYILALKGGINDLKSIESDWNNELLSKIIDIDCQKWKQHFKKNPKWCLRKCNRSYPDCNWIRCDLCRN